MPRTRLSNRQIQAIAGLLIRTNKTLDWALGQICATGSPDDTSLQTLETLISFCEGCNVWKPIEEYDGRFYCSACADYESIPVDCYEDDPGKIYY